jgi:hypothetical protein
MRRALLLTALLAAAVPAAPAQAARVDVMVAGRDGVLRDAAPVTLKAATVEVAGRRCRVGAATPLAALARTSLRARLKLRDFGSCSRRARDAAGLYVRGIGRQVERGRDGWVYKIGRRAPGTGAGDPATRLRRGDRLLWFWCRSGAGGCQRTLELRPSPARVAAGQPVRFTVTAYDDEGRGVPAAGATVAVGGDQVTADADGVATVTAPARPVTLEAVAVLPGTVRSFPVRVRVA